MKDITISVKHQKTEIFVLSICFLVAFALNVVAVLVYKTQWRELYTQLHVVVLLSLFLYLLTWVVRLVFIGIRAAWQTIIRKK